MPTVTYRQPRNSGYAGFNRAAYAPILDQLRDARVVAIYLGDDNDCAMFREARSDCNFRKLCKREMRALAAEIAEIAEGMEEKNPFLFTNMKPDDDGKTGLDRQYEMLVTSEETRDEARRKMEKAGWKPELIDSYIIMGRDKSDQAKRTIRDQLLARDLSNNEAHVLGRKVCSLRDSLLQGKLNVWTWVVSALIFAGIAVWFWPAKWH